MLHEPVSPGGKDPAAGYKMRVGVWMFILYSLFYAIFVAVNIYSPAAMKARVLGGMNLATVYGFALIIVALLQALVYDSMCRARERALAAKDSRPSAPPPASSRQERH